MMKRYCVTLTSLFGILSNTITPQVKRLLLNMNNKLQIVNKECEQKLSIVNFTEIRCCIFRKLCYTWF